MNNIPAYKTERIHKENKKIRYLFESKGHRSIIKAIEYTPVTIIDGKTVYNLGFGDYNEKDGQIFDDTNSNNGDMRKVFSTVLNTVPKFFRANRNAAIWVQGSDSAENFKRICELDCKKNCNLLCKNFNRRIKTYRYYVDKNFEALNEEYTILGYRHGKIADISQYIPGNEYLGIMVFKKK